jgi:hypothetical protein
MRNIDSKVSAAGFDYFKFLFHRRHLATFATQSEVKRTCTDASRCLLLREATSKQWIETNKKPPTEAAAGLSAKGDNPQMQIPIGSGDQNAK